MYSVNIEIYGEVTKHGFLPSVWLLAPEYQISGWIAYDGDHALMQAQGDVEQLKQFIRELPKKLRPWYQIQEVVVKSSEIKDEPKVRQPFKILEAPGEFPAIRPDHTLCPTCLAEINSAENPRYAYPYWSCNKCGPSYSAMLMYPFTRRNTVYSAFPPCKKCEAERKHTGAELLACPDCGPRAFLLDRDRNILSDNNCFCEARKLLCSGSILALQTLYGSFQLLCRSTKPDAIRTLRERKKIPYLPLTVIAKSIEAVERICIVSAEEKKLLMSEAAPVVLLTLRQDAPEDFPARLISPESNRIAVCLPQSGPQTLLLLPHEGTESNVEPFSYLVSHMEYEIELTLDELFERLRNVTDYYLYNDLRTGNGCIPSKAFIHNGEIRLLRRSRGYVPGPLNLITPLKRSAAAFGCDQNSTVAIGAGRQIIASQFLGDICSERGAAQLTGLLKHMFTLFNMAPDVVVCDMNPALYTSTEAANFADQYAIPLILVQNHHAQALACMAEHGLNEALALVFDNGAIGPDGNFWGAELLEVQIENFKRLATFAPVILPGGHTGIFRPARQLAGRMIAAGLPLSDDFLHQWNIPEEEAAIWQKICLEQNGRYVVTHAAMRLFESVSAALGIAPDFCSYRGQTAVRLYHAATERKLQMDNIPGHIKEKFAWSAAENEDGVLTIDWQEMFRRLTPCAQDAEAVSCHAIAFHDAIASAACEMAIRSTSKTRIRDIVLSGSLFCNEILSDMTKNKLQAAGFRVYEHKFYPATGSALCAGQLYHAGTAK